MHVFINERPVAPLAVAGGTVGEVLEAARVYVDPGEIIVALEIDGSAFSAGDHEHFAHRPVAGVERLVLASQPPAVFAAIKRRELADTVQIVVAKVRKVGELLRAPDTQAANALLAALMEELRLALLLDHHLAILDQTARLAPSEALMGTASAMLDAEQGRDWSRLAHLLDTELAPLLETWMAASRAAPATPAVGAAAAPSPAQSTS